jgi:hypothetical protein
MIKRTLVLSILAALALPAAALAKQHDVTGPVTVAGKGVLRAELTAGAEPAGPVLVATRGGLVRFVDLSGDLAVKCQGKGRSATKKDAEGRTVAVCAGRGASASATGSHFRVVALAGRYRATIPAGYTGKLQGRFRACAEGEECAPAAAKERGAGRRGEDGAAAKERGAGRPAGDAAAPQE